MTVTMTGKPNEYHMSPYILPCLMCLLFLLNVPLWPPQIVATSLASETLPIYANTYPSNKIAVCVYVYCLLFVLKQLWPHVDFDLGDGSSAGY